ncbi:hypothetical protein K443DRAFT_682734 [Laccaria amethystina LaAM-08-1]|uniref:Uncharacterized protein n=1 Tax=Laccaria amethystina LaAM-08-1 TaxID=1095629 RepID=A0A0C9XDK9_9AGAR|nr:hypothetical protein K443DRAFT_682734 [Laccaria amethystina LaAM-08-1]
MQKQGFGKQDVDTQELDEQDISSLVHSVEPLIVECGIGQGDRKDVFAEGFVEVSDDDLFDVRSFEVIEWDDVAVQQKQGFDKQEVDTQELDEQDISSLAHSVEPLIVECGIGQGDGKVVFTEGFVEVSDDDLFDIRSFEVIEWDDVVDDHIPDEEVEV